MVSEKEFDFIEGLVAPIPGFVIGEMLGVAESDRPQLRTWSENIVQFFEPERTEAHRQLAEQAAAFTIAWATTWRARIWRSCSTPFYNASPA